MTEIYVPPNGLNFRLLGYLSQNVLFSRTHAEPQVGHNPATQEYPDQYFTLVHGTGNHKGHYMIKSKHTGKVLFSRRHAEPYVGHADANSQYDDQWFELQPGKGQYAMHFRLLTPSINHVLFSRTHAKPFVSNTPSSSNYADQYFSFLWEDLRVDKIEYDLKLGKIISSTPIILANQTLTNNSSDFQEMKFEVNKTETHTSTFEYMTGVTLAIGTTIKGGVPLIAESEFRVDMSMSQEWRFGEQNSFSMSYVASFPVKAGAGRTVRAVSTVNRGELEVPYTIHLSSKSSGMKVETKGKWRGVSTWDLRHTISEDQ